MSYKVIVFKIGVSIICRFEQPTDSASPDYALGSLRSSDEGGRWCSREFLHHSG